MDRRQPARQPDSQTAGDQRPRCLLAFCPVNDSQLAPSQPLLIVTLPLLVVPLRNALNAQEQPTPLPPSPSLSYRCYYCHCRLSPPAWIASVLDTHHHHHHRPVASIRRTDRHHHNCYIHGELPACVACQPSFRSRAHSPHALPCTANTLRSSTSDHQHIPSSVPTNALSVRSIDRQNNSLPSPTLPHQDDPSSSSSPPQQSPDTDFPDAATLKQTPPFSDPASVEPSSGAHRTLKSNAPRDTVINLKAPKDDRERRKRNRVTPEQLIQLEAAFGKDRSPTSTERRELSNRIGMPERAVQIWFQNRSVNMLRTIFSAQHVHSTFDLSPDVPKPNINHLELLHQPQIRLRLAVPLPHPRRLGWLRKKVLRTYSRRGKVKESFEPTPILLLATF